MTDHTLTIGNTVYELSEACIDWLVETAQCSYSDNGYVDVHVQSYDSSMDVEGSRGDPILVIETAGQIVPATELIQSRTPETQAKPLDQMNNGDNDSDDSNDKQDAESSDGKMTSLTPDRPEDKATFTIDQAFEDLIDDEAYIEQLENGRLPQLPQPEKKIPHFLQVMPDFEGEVWATGEALIPVTDTYYRNVQRRVDEPPRPVDTDRNELEELRQTTAEQWEDIMNMFDCEVVEQIETQSKEETKKPWNYDSTDEGETKQSGEVGTRWNL